MILCLFKPEPELVDLTRLRLEIGVESGELKKKGGGQKKETELQVFWRTCPLNSVSAQAPDSPASPGLLQPSWKLRWEKVRSSVREADLGARGARTAQALVCRGG